MGKVVLVLFGFSVLTLTRCVKLFDAIDNNTVFKGEGMTSPAGTDAVNVQFYPSSSTQIVEYRVYRASASGDQRNVGANQLLSVISAEDVLNYDGKYLYALTTGQSQGNNFFVVSALDGNGREFLGTRILRGSPTSYVTPRFEGIANLRVSGITSVEIEWPFATVTSGSIREYRIFKSLDPQTTNFATPYLTVSADGQTLTDSNGNTSTIAAITTNNNGLQFFRLKINNIEAGKQYFSVRAIAELTPGNYVSDMNLKHRLANLRPIDASTPAPQISSFSPVNGPKNQVTRVRIFGDNFYAATSIYIGNAVCTNKVFITENEVECDAPGSSVTGPVAVRAEHPAPSSLSTTATQTFYYTDQPPPVISFIRRQAGLEATGLTSNGTQIVLISGSQFNNPKIYFDGLECIKTVPATSTTILCTAPSYPYDRAVDVNVINQDTQNDLRVGGFKYQHVPILNSMTPTIGHISGGLLVRLRGQYFSYDTINDLKIDFYDSTQTATQGSVCSQPTPNATLTELTCMTTAHIASGTRVRIQQSSGANVSSTFNFTYTSQIPPEIISYKPKAGPRTGNTTVKVKGRYFQTGSVASEVYLSNIKIDPLKVNTLSDTLLNFLTPGTSTIGVRSLRIRNSDGQEASIDSGFTYTDAPAPVVNLSAVNPRVFVSTSSDPQVLIIPALNLVNSGTLKTSVLTSDGVDFCSSTTITLNPAPAMSEIRCTVNTALPLGSYTLEVTNPDTQYAEIPGIQITDQQNPVISSVSPSFGAPTGSGQVVVNGANFATGSPKPRLYFIADGVSRECTSVGSVTATTVTCTSMPSFSPTSSYAGKLVDVQVVNPNTQSGTGIGKFTFTDTLSIASVFPSSGSMYGGGRVEINGRNLLAGTQVWMVKPSGLCGANEQNCDTPCDVLSIQPTATGQKLTCQTRAKFTGTYPIKITSPDLQSVTTTSAAMQFTYRVPLMVMNVAPNDDFSSGTAFAVRGQGFVSSASGGTLVSILDPTKPTTDPNYKKTATCSSITSQEIACTAPAPNSAGYYDLMVENPDGQTFVSKTAIKYGSPHVFSSVELVSGTYSPFGIRNGVGAAVSHYSPGLLGKLGSTLYLFEQNIIRSLDLTTSQVFTEVGIFWGAGCNTGNATQARVPHLTRSIPFGGKLFTLDSYCGIRRFTPNSNPANRLYEAIASVAAFSAVAPNTIFQTFTMADENTFFIGTTRNGSGDNTQPSFIGILKVVISTSGTITVTRLAGTETANSSAVPVFADSPAGATNGLSATLGTSKMMTYLSGNLYVTDYTYNRIRKINPTTGVVTTVAGNGSCSLAGTDTSTGSPATTGTVCRPFSPVVVNGKIIFGEDNRGLTAGSITASENLIREYDPVADTLTTLHRLKIADTPADGAEASDARVYRILTFEADAQTVYFTDGGVPFASLVRKLDRGLKIVSTLTGQYNQQAPAQDSFGSAQDARFASAPVFFSKDNLGNLILRGGLPTYQYKSISEDNGFWTSQLPILPVSGGDQIVTDGTTYYAYWQCRMYRWKLGSTTWEWIAGSATTCSSVDGVGTAATFINSNNQRNLALVGTKLYLLESGTGNIRVLDTETLQVTTIRTNYCTTTDASGATITLRSRDGSGTDMCLFSPYSAVTDGRYLYFLQWIEDNRRSLRKFDLVNNSLSTIVSYSTVSSHYPFYLSVGGNYVYMNSDQAWGRDLQRIIRVRGDISNATSTAEILFSNNVTTWLEDRDGPTTGATGLAGRYRIGGIVFDRFNVFFFPGAYGVSRLK